MVYEITGAGTFTEDGWSFPDVAPTPVDSPYPCNFDPCVWGGDPLLIDESTLGFTIAPMTDPEMVATLEGNDYDPSVLWQGDFFQDGEDWMDGAGPLWWGQLYTDVTPFNEDQIFPAANLGTDDFVFFGWSWYLWTFQ